MFLPKNSLSQICQHTYKPNNTDSYYLFFKLKSPLEKNNSRCRKDKTKCEKTATRFSKFALISYSFTKRRLWHSKRVLWGEHNVCFSSQNFCLYGEWWLTFRAYLAYLYEQYYEGSSRHLRIIDNTIFSLVVFLSNKFHIIDNFRSSTCLISDDFSLNVTNVMSNY